MDNRNTPDNELKPKGASRIRGILIGVVLGIVGIGGLAAAGGASVSNVSPLNEENGSRGKSLLVEDTPKVEVRIEKERRGIPYQSLIESDASQYEGVRYVKTAGVAGTSETTHDVTLVNGVEKSRIESGTVVIVEPVHEVTVVGTKKQITARDCADGSYVNSAGNTVCRPAASNSGVPEGATAQCKNGQYSFSQSRRGTCSGNGGVARWL